MSTCLLFLGDIGGSELMLLMLLPMLFIVNFIPSFIARKRSDFLVIFLVNILAGWTVIGWLVALYLALRRPLVYLPATAAASGNPASFVADELIKLRNLRDQGVLTAQEFERQKNTLLG
ncbi:superinfection immunity protein [Hymenobacter sp.]|uniref:superinfection immunity protein n=1 Tax=Hymenobacter sp. TaxID=1898978 RepID=UPI00286C44A9|nr:superinfection immunity protein [Hymenobacter sp.]